ncbi:hypothetical protein NZH93_23430 [Umezawaea endophytica]|uniref:Uncharacterized protein n=1 Tax=Umezawaea endophytica TaxID=1654476 RepID=A0A9X2VNM0_9PSEU|nr:hypothetical protein [Umezawaea endophytica]
MVTAIVGNPLISGFPNVNARLLNPPVAGMPSVTTTTNGTTIARISGGCTTGPNMLLRSTNTIAPTHPTKNRMVKIHPTVFVELTSMNVPMIASTKAMATAAHQGRPLKLPKRARSFQATSSE